MAGRLAAAPGLLEAARRAAGRASRRCARWPARGQSAPRGAALLADGLAGGRYAPLVECLRLREARGSALDHLRMYGEQSIRPRLISPERGGWVRVARG